ncbi:ABC transporter permease, partial [Anaerostipes hadrus]|uniref:ABC transporter permease n=1 Tax=Anaerostipes hadrus TaxID=649756 RepID=UPI001C014E4A
EILGQKYYLSGIINDYSVAWNHPKDETGIFPTILVSKSNTSLQNKKLVNTRHLLIENEKNFQDKIYQKHKNLISNENKKTQDTSGRYEIPTFLIVLMIGCEVLLDLYVFSYYLEAMREKLSILRCLGMTKMECFVYIGKKVIVLFALGGILGSLIGTAGAKFILWIFSKVTGTVLVLSIISKYYIFSFGFVAIAVIVAWVFMIRKIRYLSPMELFRKSDQKIKFRSKPKKVKKMTIIQLSIRYFKVRIRKLVMIVLMIAVTITLFLSVNLYVTQYQAQFVTDTAYTDKKGSQIKLYAIPNEDSIFHLPDYTKIVPDKLINNMKKNKDIQSVKSYLEVNDLYLLNAPEESENPYVSTYMNDRILDDCIAKEFSISNNTRGRAIHMDKILSGEEVLLMVPSYEVEEDGDGGMMQAFLSKGQYQGKKNQYKDQKYSVGDTLDFVQITSKDSRLKGYINEQQAK